MQLAQSISNCDKSSATYFRAVQQRVKGVVDSGQLSLFASGYWGHPAYILPPDVNLMAVAHYLEALSFQKDFIRIHAVLGGKNPHPQSFLVGGMSTAMDPDEPAAVINPERIVFMRDLVRGAKKFVEEYYIPDVLAIAPFYKDWFTRGEGLGNFLCWRRLFIGRRQGSKDVSVSPRGIGMGRDMAKCCPSIRRRSLNPSRIRGTSIPAAIPPANIHRRAKPIRNTRDRSRLTIIWMSTPNIPGSKRPATTASRWKWSPLARMIVGYASGKKEIRDVVDGALKALNAPPAVLFSTLGRIRRRSALEARKSWSTSSGCRVNQLDANLSHGNTTIFNPIHWDPGSWPKSSSGYGWHEAPRGSLGHWVEIDGKSIRNYQAVVPTTWNAGPRDAQGQRGAYEAALLNTPVADANRPLEILRTVHSFDPCIACAVHVIDAQGREYIIPRVA